MKDGLPLLFVTFSLCVLLATNYGKTTRLETRVEELETLSAERDVIEMQIVANGHDLTVVVQKMFDIIKEMGGMDGRNTENNSATGS